MFRLLDAKFSCLDELPDSLYVPLVTHSHGTLMERVVAILHWRACLLAGRLPLTHELAWPENSIKETVLARLAALNIATYCCNQTALTDQLLLDVLHVIGAAEELVNATSDIESDQSTQQHNDSHGFHGASRPSAEAAKANIQVTALTQQILERRWLELIQIWDQLSAAYRDIGAVLGNGWDLSQGVLAAEGWRDVVRYRGLLAELPQLAQLVAMLGRCRDIASQPALTAVSQQLFSSLRRARTEDACSDQGRRETGGVVLSADIDRMLPSELALLGHPRLKMLWYAKRAERKLLTYSHVGLTNNGPRSEMREADAGIKETRQAAGPIIVCLDTSASMQGRPEMIAKALVLEAVRIALAENRHCLLYAFGGERQLMAHELDLTHAGLIKLMRFLRYSFRGGTDVVFPLLSALAKQASEAWQDADILLVTDGRFPCQVGTFARVEAVKRRQGLRIHGVLVGDWRSSALEALCDPLHRLAAWLPE